jgi:hypothetical protein
MDKTTQNDPSTKQEPTTAGELFLGGLVMTVLSVVVIGGLFWAIGGGIGWLVEWENPGWKACQDRTRAMLLDPSSASFGAPSTATATDDDRVVRFRYTVSATNGFGARIEQEFFCIVDDSKPTRTITVY